MNPACLLRIAGENVVARRVLRVAQIESHIPLRKDIAPQRAESEIYSYAGVAAS